jgi:hypothetical protein
MTSESDTVYLVFDDFTLGRFPDAVFYDEEKAKDMVSDRLEHHREEIPDHEDIDVTVWDYNESHKCVYVDGMANSHAHHIAYSEFDVGVRGEE